VRSDGPGDLMAHVVVETPINLTERQKELLREFDEICCGHEQRHNPRAKGFMDKVKEFFTP
jgi:molecular chaperone DnaJ